MSKPFLYFHSLRYMAAVINSVANSDMAVLPLTTSSNSIVSRRRVKLPSNAATTYSHVANTFGGKSTIEFQISDAECFLDLKSLAVNAQFTPMFYKYCTELPTSWSSLGVGVGYAPGSGPSIDGGVHSLIARLRVSDNQGMVIEDILQYGLMTNALSLHSTTVSDKDDRPLQYGDSSANNQGKIEDSAEITSYLNLTAGNSSFLSDMNGNSQATIAENVVAGNVTLGQAPVGGAYDVTAVRDLQLNFNSSSFLNSMRYMPLFLMRNGLKIEIELENPLLAFYCAYGWPTPRLLSTVDNIFTCGAWLASNDNFEITFDYKLGQPNLASIGPGDILLGYKNGQLLYSQQVAIVHPLEVLYPVLPVAANTNYEIEFSNQTRLRTAGSPILWGTSTFGQTFAVDQATLAAKIDAFYVIPAPQFNAALPDGISLVPSNSSQQTVNGPYWNYRIDNPEMLLDLVKPSSEVMREYLNRFQLPEGIPYAFNRVQHINKVWTYNSSNASVQLPLNIAVRSLKGLVIVLTDDLSTSTGSGAPIYNFPSKSAFMLRGCTEAYVSIGSQQFPLYKLRMDNSTATNQLRENDTLFQTSMTNGVTLRTLNRNMTNYQLCGGITQADGTQVTKADNSFLTECYKSYSDTRSAVLCFSMMKRDGDFVSGVDTSQSGSVVLNLAFDTTKYPSGAGDSPSRNVNCHIFAIADAVFTLQKDSNGVRY